MTDGFKMPVEGNLRVEEDMTPMVLKKSCSVEVIATGDELMYGRITDTNSN